MKTLGSEHSCQEIIKKSRFIAHAIRIDAIDDAMAYLKQISQADANHNCWAYKLGDQYRFSDDGEPGGTAGRPIYMAIEQQDFDHVMVVVTRYFGGIKLGAGGLARAYGGIAGKCLQHATPYTVENRTVFNLTVPFSGTGIVYPFLDGYPQISRIDESYTDTGLQFTLRIVETEFEAFRTAAMNASSGTFGIEVVAVVWE